MKRASKPQAGLTLAEVENLFIEKLQEKYQLTARDIQRAFKRFDRDGSGYLSVAELASAMQLYLNGVEPSKVRELVSRYDVDGDGQISLEEFSQFLLSRNSADRNEWLSVDGLTSAGPQSQLKPQKNSRSSPLSPQSFSAEQDSEPVDYQAKLFLHNLKSSLLKKSLEMRSEGKLSHEYRRGMHTSELAEVTARSLIARAFEPHTTGRKAPTVNFSTFARVVGKFVYPGSGQPSDELMLFLFRLCGGDDEIDQRADPNILIDVMFDKPSHQINKFGFSDPTRAATDTRRPAVGRGPISNDAAQPPLEISKVPFRFATKHCRTALAAPTNFTLKMVQKSSEAPRFTCRSNHIFGMNTLKTSLNSGESIWSLHDGCLLYSSASVVVMQSPKSNRQEHLMGHTNDITCLAVSPDGALIASGQIGKTPEIVLWSTERSSGEDYLLGRFGSGFFQRGICAVEFTFDSAMIIGVSCDDHHMIGIWAVATGRLMCSCVGHSGVPPAIKWMKSSPCFQYTAFVTKDHGPRCDILCTVGERHLKFWSIQRPSRSDSSGCSIEGRMYRVGKVKVEVPKIFTCVAFASPKTGIEPDEGSGQSDVITGGDNGWLLVWRLGLCLCGVVVIPNGTIHCLEIHRSGFGNDILFCGGDGGVVCQVDPRTLDILATYSTQQQLAPLCEPVGLFAGLGEGARPRSASTGRIGSVRRNSTSTLDMRSPRAGAAGASSGLVSNEKTLQSKKKTSTKPRDAWIHEGATKSAAAPDGVKGTAAVLSIAIVYDSNRSERNILSVVAVTGVGKTVRFNVSPSDYRRESVALNPTPETMFYHHYGPLWGLATIECAQDSLHGLFLTGGDDRWLSLWDSVTRRMIARVRTKNSIRCIDAWESTVGTNRDIRLEVAVGVGCTNGWVHLYLITAKKPVMRNMNGVRRAFDREEGDSSQLEFSFQLVASKHDCAEDIGDIKFSPNGKMLAVGSHDNFIDIYHHKHSASTNESAARSELKQLKRLRGHSSYITHLDWSADNHLLRSTCGSYELLFWDVSTGRQALSSLDCLEADAIWHTQTCVLGFAVMGIWPSNADGTDVNSVVASDQLGVVVTGDDFGGINVFNYPCVAKSAPSIAHSGHSSHVLNVKLLHDKVHPNARCKILSVGGNDCAAFVWDLIRK